MPKWFECNKVNGTARRLLHAEYAMYFTRNRGGKGWNPRAELEIYRREIHERQSRDQGKGWQVAQALLWKQDNPHEQQSREE